VVTKEKEEKDTSRSKPLGRNHDGSGTEDCGVRLLLGRDDIWKGIQKERPHQKGGP